MISASARKRSTFELTISNRHIHLISLSFSLTCGYFTSGQVCTVLTQSWGTNSVLALHYDEFCKVRAYITRWLSIRPTDVRSSNVANFTYRRRILWALLQISFSKDFWYTTLCVQWWYLHPVNDSSVDFYRVHVWPPENTSAPHKGPQWVLILLWWATGVIIDTLLQAITQR